VLNFPKANLAQAPTLGTTADFVLFSTVGAVSNTGITHLTGHVGTNSGSSTGFGNVDGVMHDQDPASAQATADLLIAYNQLNATVPTFFPGALLGSGQILNAGVYSIPSPATLNLTLTLDAQGDPNAVFIFQIGGAFSTGANAKVVLINGGLACNVFWKVEGLVNMAAGTTMRGTIVANNAAIVMNTADTLEGRALSIAGAITVDGILARIPIGCGSPILTGPANPVLGTTECYVLFSGIGPVTNSGVTTLTGDIGTNSGLTTGFNPLFITGTIHPIPDGSTAQCGTDFTTVYNSLNALPYDIELLYPAQFGNNLELTPHTYLMNGAVTFTDTLILNAQGNANAVFIIQINGAFGTSTYSNVVLKNGAQAKNVYWKIDGAVDINDYSIFRGTIISQGAINLYTGVTLNGRALTGVGAVNTTAINGVMPSSCAPFTVTEPADQIACEGSSASFSISATGVGLTYQWRKGNTNLINGGAISGANTATLTINPVTVLDAATDYNVIVSGTFMPTDTSNNVSLTITVAPLITTQPINVTACVGDSIAFVVVASGIGNTYQWKKGLVDLVDGVSISGATTATLIIDPISVLDAAIDYSVIVSGTCPPDDTSTIVSLTVNVAPLITSQPINVTACVGDSIAFVVVASGIGNTYQWKKGLVDLVDGASISGATTDTLIIDPVSATDAGINYSVIVSGVCSPSDTSNIVSLTVNVAPLITSQPINVTACVGDSIAFVVVASGIGNSYQWKKGLVDLVDGASISGATTATLIINPISATDAGIDYSVIVSGVCSPSDTSNNVSITIINCGIDLSITKTASSMTPAVESTVSFSITANYVGDVNATNVQVSEVLQSGYVFVSYSSTVGTYDNLTGIWTIGTMIPGTQATLTLVATVALTGNYDNTVVITSDLIETNIANNTATILLVPNDFFIPEGFSPNNDLINDVFVIRGILNFPNNKFTVFNRWGVRVYEMNGYQNTWNGTSDSDFNLGGDVLPVGTYFYILDLGDGSDVIKGTIYLNN